jgi:hypothetical protein
MEEIVYAAALGTLVGFGLYVGKRWALSNGHAVLLGLAVTVVVAVALICFALALAVVSPGSLEPRRMGFLFGGMLLFGWVVGVVAALSGRRRAVKAAAGPF